MRCRTHLSVIWMILVLLSLSPVARACIWDYDTLRDEQRGLPGVLEALTGRFERRSEFFYRDRIQRMERHRVASPFDLAAIDNHAVALFRIGEIDRAIEMMKEKESRFPNQYTTSSNLATFYMLSGQVEPAIPLLEKALTINPNAHFGRERFQLELAKHLVDPNRNQSTLIQHDSAEPREIELKDFLQVTWSKLVLKHKDDDANHAVPWIVVNPGKETPEAVTAIIGMIRFGTEQSPDLYLALGNQLTMRGDLHLAVRAYFRAIEEGHPDSRHIEVVVERLVDRLWPETTVAHERERFEAERVEARRWSQAYQDHADQLIRDGGNPDLEANYESFYAQHGKSSLNLIPTTGERLRGWLNLNPHQMSKLVTFFAILAAGIAILLIARRLRTIRHKKLQSVDNPSMS